MAARRDLGQRRSQQRRSRGDGQAGQRPDRRPQAVIDAHGMASVAWTRGRRHQFQRGRCLAADVGKRCSPDCRDSSTAVSKRLAGWANTPDSCGAEAGAKASIDADPTHHRRRAPPPLPWRPYCRIAGWSPTPNTGLSSGKKNPAKPRSVAAENGPPAALPSPNRWLFHGLFPATGVRDNIRGVAFDQNSCQSLAVVVRRGHRRVSKLSSGTR